MAHVHNKAAMAAEKMEMGKEMAKMGHEMGRMGPGMMQMGHSMGEMGGMTEMCTEMMKSGMSHGAASGMAAGAAVAAAGRQSGKGLLGIMSKHPLLVLGLGIAAGYFIHKYREEILSTGAAAEESPQEECH